MQPSTIRPLHPLPPAAQHRLTAAEGWLELGDLLSASDDLDVTAPILRAHPAGLRIRVHNPLWAQNETGAPRIIYSRAIR